MSYTVSLVIDTGAPELVEIDGTWRNYTYNVSRMFYEALGGDGLYGLNGMSAKSAAKRLDRAIAAMQENREVYEQWNPENGWGDYDGALAFLVAIRHDCLTHPKATVYVR